MESKENTMTLNERIKTLENEVLALQSKILDLSANVEEKSATPYVLAGGTKNPATNMPIDAKTGKAPILGGHVIWNDSEGKVPPLNEEPPDPKKGYNKHSHSRYSGGALIKDKLEIVEYKWGSITNKESQQFWETQPSIVKVVNTKNESVEKIGLLDLVFNPDTKTWGVSAYEIDVAKCYLVQRDVNGAIKKDSKGQDMKSFLYNEDTTKTSVIWDENSKCWRFLAVYAPTEEV